MGSSSTFKRDLGRFIAADRPVALARFHDGEYHVLRELPYDARSGWHLYRPSWMRDRLAAALASDLDGFWVGISPPCDFPVGTAYYRRHVKTKRLTYATVFWHSNYPVFRQWAARAVKTCCVVGSSRATCDHVVPANGVANEWDIDGLVDALLEETRPILLAAGPCACVIAHQYWSRCPPDSRQTILDVGASLDPIILGRTTRHYQTPEGSRLLRHECRWDKAVPFSSKAKRKVKGYRARLAGMRTRYGGKKKAT